MLRRSREGRADLVGLPARTARALAGALQADPDVRWGPTQVARALRRDSDEAAYAALEAGSPLAGTDEATQRIAVHPDGGTSRSAAAGAPTGETAVVGPPTQLVGPPTQLVGPPTQLVGAPTALAGPPSHDGYTRAMPVVTGATPAVTGPIPVGEVRYQAFDHIAATAGVPDDDAESVEPLPPEPYVAPPLARRSGTVLAFLVPLVVLGATRPVVAVGVAAILVVLCRVAGQASQAIRDRRERYGAVRRSDGVVATVAFPWHAILGALGSIPQLLVAGCVGVLVVVGGYWLFGAGRVIVMPRDDIEARSVGGMNAPIVFCAVLALATLLTAVVAWFGPAGETGRRGARALLNTFAPGWIGAAVVIVACLVGAWLLARSLLEVPPVIHWWPLDGPPSL
ncbi:hypothetical protein [Xylanimonas protaetiae]|uniref:hypothetical protein n=1 Tax=Xylanimonas protaetiae TaxID=2509457 RepID=UPI001F5E1616|nr:hypothetical protein [Xylanimonas protaetiae]